jgi:hypothetical protein
MKAHMIDSHGYDLRLRVANGRKTASFVNKFHDPAAVNRSHQVRDLGLHQLR